MNNKQSSSDPLPYVQIDRAAEPTFALLAGKLKVSHQHAIGSLYEFWKLCADVRELEAIVSATPPGEEPELILAAEDVALRFELASGCKVEPVVLARLGILEEREKEKRFRVRGMSRSFEPIVARIQAREAAAKGGKASAQSRRLKTGSAQPTGGRGSKPRSEPGSEVASVAAQATTEAEPKRDGSGDRSATEAEPKPSGQRSAVSGQSPLEEDPPPPLEPPVAAFHIEPPDLAHIEEWAKEDFWRAAELTRRKLGFPPQKWPNTVALSRFWGEARAQASVRELAVAFQDFARAKHWLDAKPPAPFAAFMSQWNNFLPARDRHA